MLLHCCCGPCALAPLQELINHEIRPTLYFYNPNIYPYGEFKKRYQALKKVAKKYRLKLIKGPYRHQKWLNFLKNHLTEPPQNYPENDQRCQFCFLERLEQTARFAKKKGYQNFATTLSVNRFKDIDYINQKGRELAQNYKLNYYQFNLNPSEASLFNLRLAQELKLYRQKYCGCEFSLKRESYFIQKLKK